MKFKNKSEYQTGLLFIIGCYLIWGAFPLYWYPTKGMDAFQLMAHRIFWSFLLLLTILALKKQLRAVFFAFFQQKIFVTYFAAAFFIFFNWLTYLWAISNSYVLDASLGYYINPLVFIFLARVFLKETLSKLQYLAIIIASLGVLWLALLGKSFPFVALILAFSFGFYGLIKRFASLPALPGLFLETLFMMPYALLYLSLATYKGEQFLFQVSWLPLLVLLFSGVATTVPLILFSEGAKKVPMSLLGVLQYFVPTLQFFLGLYLFNETLDTNRLIGFIAVWIAVIIFLTGEWRRIKTSTL